jgi:mRNA-degrading endonuclease RelE of RelBE toxin-antitoxin system
MSYAIEWERNALKQLDSIQARDRTRILKRVSALGGDPRPTGVVKLGGAHERLVVIVVRVGHRREVYREP